MHRDYVANATALALNVGGLRRSLHHRGMSTVLELFRRAIQREQFKSVTYSDVKVHLFDFPIRFADLTTVNLSPANLSLSLYPSLDFSPLPVSPHPFPFADFLLFSSKPFYYCSCQSCTFKVPITRAVPAKHPFPPNISTRRSTGRSYGFFYFRKWRTENRSKRSRSYEETILIWRREIAKTDIE